MVTQYVYNGFEGGMSEKECGDFVDVGDYFDLKEKHDAFMRDARFALDTLDTNRDGADAVTDAIDNLEAAFMAEAHPRE